MENVITKEHGKGWVGLYSLKKFADKAAFERGEAYADVEVGKNLLLNEGINELFTVLCSGSGTKFDSTNANLGVGDDNTAASASQTGLIAATNKVYQVVDGGYPTYGTSQKATFRTTFDGSTANFHWQEFTIANGTSNSAKNLNRLVSDQGTKTSGQIWQLTLDVTLS